MPVRWGSFLLLPSFGPGAALIFMFCANFLRIDVSDCHKCVRFLHHWYLWDLMLRQCHLKRHISLKWKLILDMSNRTFQLAVASRCCICQFNISILLLDKEASLRGRTGLAPKAEQPAGKQDILEICDDTQKNRDVLSASAYLIQGQRSISSYCCLIHLLTKLFYHHIPPFSLPERFKLFFSPYTMKTTFCTKR